MNGCGTISIIVPVLDEEALVAATLERLREPEVREIIVVDGGSQDRTRAIAETLADRVLVHEAGRARQMNAGAAAASGAVLLFLHADTLVPRGFAAAISRALAEPGIAGGRFDVELDDRRLPFRVIGAMIRIRSRWTNRFTGDQGIFVRREIFDRLGGYLDEPLFEDLALSATLARVGRIAALSERVTTSARRWKRHGVLRTVLLMWTMRSLYELGVRPIILERWYDRAR